MHPTESLTRRRLLQQATAAALPGALAPGLAFSQADLPSARILLGSPAGSVLDFFARTMAEALKGLYAQTLMVENRTGASGQLAITGTKAAAPDGATILLTPSPMMAIYPHTYKKLPYDPVADFVPVSMGATYDLAFAVGPRVPAGVQTIPEFMAWCKADAGNAQFGTPALGSTPHFIGVTAGRQAKVDLVPVAYRGTMPAITDMLGGQVSAACAPLGDFMPFVDKSRRCRLLAITGTKRSHFAPAVPTFVEQGYPDIVTDDWWAFFLHAATPAPQVARLSKALQAALANPAVAKAMHEKCLEPSWTTAQALQASMKAQHAKWGPVVKAIGFTADS